MTFDMFICRSNKKGDFPARHVIVTDLANPETRPENVRQWVC